MMRDERTAGSSPVSTAIWNISSMVEPTAVNRIVIGSSPIYSASEPNAYAHHCKRNMTALLDKRHKILLSRMSCDIKLVVYVVPYIPRG